jgi:hypothetical protein
MRESKPTEYMVPTSTWKVEWQRGLTFRIAINEDGYYAYDSVKALPEVVEHDDRLYRRTGWNSDTGEVFYREASKADLAKPYNGGTAQKPD